jgi:hypothetical protein
MNFKLGRNRPVARGPRLSLKNYTLKSLPSPPATVDYQGRAFNSLSRILGNDLVGNCVQAGILHLIGVFTGNAGNQAVFTEQQGIQLYSQMTGFVPGEPATDQGTDEVSAFNFWEQNGVFGHKIAGTLALNPSNPAEYRTALYLFENVCFAGGLPDAWITPFPSATGFTWKSATPDQNNGHFFVGPGYLPRGLVCATWGMQGVITDPAIESFCAAENGGSLYTVLSADSINKAKQKAPNGFDFTQLIADFDAIGVTV